MSLSPPPPPGAGSPSPPPPLDSSLPSNPTLALLAPPQQQPQPSLNPRRLPPPCWSHDETVALIDAYRDKWYALRRGNLKANHWQDVADAVGLRCPNASPPKTAVQCRHKMEKLRKRYRNEIQRARSMPVSRFSSSWVHFKRMDSMEKGPQTNPDYNSGSDGGPGGDDNDDDNEDDDDENNNMGFYHPADNYKNGTTTAASILNTHHNTTTSSRSIQKLYRNGIGNTVTSVTATGSVASAAALGGGSGGSGGSGGFRIRIPSGVSIAQPAPAPAPKFYAKVDHKYSNLGSTSNSSAAAAAAAAAAVKPNYFGGVVGPSATATATRVVRGSEETGKKREREPMDEMVAAVKVLGDGFVRMEQMKMEMARELETMRMEMEMKRTEMILESQQRIVEAFAKAFSEKQQQQLQKKKKKLLLPTNARRATSSSPNS